MHAREEPESAILQRAAGIEKPEGPKAPEPSAQNPFLAPPVWEGGAAAAGEMDWAALPAAIAAQEGTNIKFTGLAVEGGLSSREVLATSGR